MSRMPGETSETDKTGPPERGKRDPSGPHSGKGRFLFGGRFSEKEEKQLFLYMICGIVLAELAITLGAVIYSIANATVGADGTPHFHFPWLGYLVAMLVAPASILLLAQLVGLVFSRPAEGGGDALEDMPPKVRALYAMVHGAPTVLVLAAFVLVGVAVYYLDGVLALLLKIGDSFQTVAIWLIGAFTVAWIISYAVRVAAQYKLRQMEAEYAFRRDVLERTGMVVLDARHAPHTETRLLAAQDTDARALPEAGPLPPDETGEPASDPAQPSPSSPPVGTSDRMSGGMSDGIQGGIQGGMRGARDVEVIDAEAMPAPQQEPERRE